MIMACFLRTIDLKKYSMVRVGQILLPATILLLASLLPLQAQIADKPSPYVEYLAGTLPLIISIPHGGYLIPADIPDRPCTNCAKNQDTYTLELGLRLREQLFLVTGKYPHMVISHLHRTRLDPNRDIKEAASGNELAEKAWREFHNYIEKAAAEVNMSYGKGLYIDLHGHRHELKRAELGYLLNGEELRLDDEFLNDQVFAEYSSIRHLISDNPGHLSYTTLLRGETSLGALFEQYGYPAVPSPANPFPLESEPYFQGGYDIMKHGSASGGSISGIQIEIDLELRSDEIRRNLFADHLALILISFMKTHFFPDSF